MYEWPGLGVSWNWKGTLPKSCAPAAGLADNGNIIDISSELLLGAHAVQIIPEPGTAALRGLGLVSFVLTARRRRPPRR